METYNLSNYLNLNKTLSDFNLSSNLVNSIIPSWELSPITNVNLYNNSNNSNPLISNIKSHVQNNFILNNQLSNINSEPISLNILNSIEKLYKLGMQFIFTTNQPIQIIDTDVLFPICCVGKNRSQYLFYYLKKLQAQTKFNKNIHTESSNRIFQVAYPMSGDELTTIILDNSNTVLSGFIVPYKSDTFSKSIENILNKEVSRSIHPFDLIIKIPLEYIGLDLKNFESKKYKTSSFDIFSSDKPAIAKLFIQYYLNPENLIKVINSQYSYSKRIIYICASPESYLNMIKLFDWMVNSNYIKNFNNVQIVYLGIQDIFQRSSVNSNLLKDFEQKIAKSFTT